MGKGRRGHLGRQPKSVPGVDEPLGSPETDDPHPAAEQGLRGLQSGGDGECCLDRRFRSLDDFCFPRATRAGWARGLAQASAELLELVPSWKSSSVYAGRMAFGPPGATAGGVVSPNRNGLWNRKGGNARTKRKQNEEWVERPPNGIEWNGI